MEVFLLLGLAVIVALALRKRGRSGGSASSILGGGEAPQVFVRTSRPAGFAPSKKSRKRR